jgi:hypothetical protein
MITNSVRNLLRYELLQFTRLERNQGLLIYLIGLPFIQYLVLWTSNSSDSTLGLGILSIIAMNILYGPVQFLVDQRYYEGFFTKYFKFADLIKGKLLFLQIVDLIMFSTSIPLLLLSFDINRFLLFTSVFLYTIGFASPASVFLSGINFRYVVNSFSQNQKVNYLDTRNLLFGLIPFVPLFLLIIMFSSNFRLLLISNFVICVTGLLFNGKICRITSHNILNRKFLC